MAFGVTKTELAAWKEEAEKGRVAFLTHFWYDSRFPQYKTVTKAACKDKSRLIAWGKKYNLKREWIHVDDHFPHFDLIGNAEKEILLAEGRAAKLFQMEALIEKKKNREGGV